MKLARRWLVFIAALFLFQQGSSAQEFIRNQRQFHRQSFFPVSPGSTYTRLHWPRAGGQSFLGLQAIHAPNAGKLLRLSPGAGEIKTALSPAHATKAAKGSLKTREVLQKIPVAFKAGGIPQASRHVPQVLQLAALAGVIVLLLLAIASLFRTWGARRIERRTSVAPDLPKRPPLDKTRGQEFRSSQGASASVEAQAPVDSNSANAEFSGPLASPESIPSQSAPAAADFAGEATTADLDQTPTSDSAADLCAFPNARFRSGIGLGISGDLHVPLRLPETREESRLPKPIKEIPAPPSEKTPPVPAPVTPIEYAPTADEEAASQPPVSLAQAEPTSDLREAPAASVRHVRVTGGNLRNNHLYLPLDFFPVDAIGGANIALAAPKNITVAFNPGVKVETDIDRSKKILRNRSAVGDFLARAEFVEGDCVRICRIGPYSYEFTKGTPAALGLVEPETDADYPPEHDSVQDLPEVEGESPPDEVLGEHSAVVAADVAPAPQDHADFAEIAPADDVAGLTELAGKATTPCHDVGVGKEDRALLGDSFSPIELAEAPPTPVVELCSPPDAALSGDVVPAQTPDEERAVPAPVAAFDEAQPPKTKIDGVEALDEAATQIEATPDFKPSPALAPEAETVAQETPSEAPPTSAPVVQESLENLSEFARSPEVIAPAIPEPTPTPPRAPAGKGLQPAADQAPVLIAQSKPKPIRVPDAKAYDRLEQKWKDELFGPILAHAGTNAPDGRPLYAYPFAPEDYSSLEAFLSRRMRGPEALQSTGTAFVFWAAEHIRANFPRAGERHLTWAFLFDAFGLPEDQTFARTLVGKGLKWWGRGVRKAINGNQLYLYSLLVEGGLPEALLRQEGLYQRVILGLLEDIEAEGGVRGGPAVAEPLAAGWSTALPQTFQGEDFIRLLAEFGLALAELRTAPPLDLPPEKIQSWLDENRPNWAGTLPLRASAETINRLIVPALQIERSERAQAAPLVTRELRRDLKGCWRGFVRFAEQGWIPAALLPAGVDLRLRLVSGGALMKSEGAPSLFASPESGGWQVRLFGKTRSAVVPLDLFAPVNFTAFADAQQKGEIELDSGLPEAEDSISLWRPAEGHDGTSPDVLTLSPTGRTIASCLWALAPSGVHPTASDGLSIEGPEEAAAGGALWRVCGKGEMSFGDACLSIETSADNDAPEARLLAFGDTLQGWKTARGAGLVFLGRPLLWGQKGSGDLRKIDDRNLAHRKTRGRTFAQHVAEWVENGAPLCRLRYASLPETTLISLCETAPGKARLTIDGLDGESLKATARAGAVSAQATLTSGACEIELKTAGATPGEISLRLLDLATGGTLDLVAPWPARRGMMLDAEGLRLDRDHPIAVNSLSGWRAIVPPDMRGYLQFRLHGRPPLALSVAGEIPLGAHLPLIRALLAQGGPDAQVDVRLIVNGYEGPRLEARRYADGAVLQNGVLQVGLVRDAPPPVENAFSATLATPREAMLHAVDLRGGEPMRLDVTAPCDLRTVFSVDGGPWVIQPRVDGRPQRAVFFNPSPSPATSREDRINAFARKFHYLLQKPLDPGWTQLLRLIEALAEGGDPGCADQVQALAKVPQAVIMLALWAPRHSFVEALALDLVTPIFWPALPVKAFIAAVQNELSRQRSRFLNVFEETEANEEAASAVLDRIGSIVTLKPEISAHFGKALQEDDLLLRAMLQRAPQALRESAFIFDPARKLSDLAQEAARRFDRLPDGLRGLAPRRRPPGLSFNSDVQAVVDAPIVTAEIAAGLRPPANMAECLSEGKLSRMSLL